MESNKKRLAKNTILLYIRTLITLAVGLFTARVIINALGVSDYGIYNIVGGFVSLFSILGGVLISATQRYMNFELGKKEQARSYEVFGAAIGINLGISIFLLVVLETFGLWFLNYKLNIPSDRLLAANWVFQCSIITFIVNILSAPYNAAIIAHEKMSAFAYISMLDAFLKLGVAYLLYVAGFDKLIVYSILLTLVAIFIRYIYSSYCTRHFSETKFHVSKEKKLYKEMTGFASMTFLGRLASILSSQGVSIILNIFFGVTVNAARGIALQVNTAVMKFVSDFTTALNPQITKRYAGGDNKGMFKLCCTGAKLSFFLLILFAVPIFFKAPYILKIWLKTFPEETIVFIRLTMLVSLCSVLSQPLIIGILSTGNIKSMCLIIGTVHLFVLPISYLVLWLNYPAYSVYIVSLFIELILLFIRLSILCKLIKESVLIYIKNVVLRILPALIISFLVGGVTNKMFDNNFVDFILVSFITILISGITSFFFGLTTHERYTIINYVARMMIKFKKQ